jgi:hypothetical protein
LGARHAWLGHLHVQAAQKDLRLISSAKDICYVPQVFEPLQNLQYLQHIAGFESPKNLRYHNQ